jgi:hypothetical protein
VLFAPDLRANYGSAQDKEVTIEGDLVHALTASVPGISLIGNIASLKTVLREVACTRNRDTRRDGV